MQLAEEMLKEQTRKLVEENISTALNIVKSRTRAAYVLFPSLIFVKQRACIVKTVVNAVGRGEHVNLE